MAMARQEEALAFIRSYYRTHGVAPTMREIAQELGLAARSHAHRLVSELLAQGLVEQRVVRGVSTYEPVEQGAVE